MQAKYIFKVISSGITYPLGDVNLMVPKTLAKTAAIEWSMAGLVISTSDTSFIVASDGSELLCKDKVLIPWHETLICLVKEDKTFAKIQIQLTDEENQWREFKSRIAHTAECFVAEIRELNSELHKSASTAGILVESYELLKLSIAALEKHYADGLVEQNLYKEMKSKWEYLKFMTACRISADTAKMRNLSDAFLHEILNYAVKYAKSN